MKNNIEMVKDISKAFWNVLDEYSDEDVRLILEHKDEVFTRQVYWRGNDCFDEIVGTGKCGRLEFSRLSKDSREECFKEGNSYYREGELLALLNSTADEYGIHLPDELKLDEYDVVEVKVVDLCDKWGELYPLVDGRYAAKWDYADDDVERAIESKEDLFVPALDLTDGKEKTLVYHWDKIGGFLNFLDLNEGYTVEE